MSGVDIVGAPWRTKHPSADLCAELLARLQPADDTIRIAVAHGQVDTLSPDQSRPETIDLANAEAAIADRRIHYLALGDRHSVTEVGTTGRVWYSGAPVATDFDENEPGKALLVELGDDGYCEVERLEVGDWTFVAHQAEVNTEEDFERFQRWLEALPAKARTIVKVGFTGSINLSIASRIDELFEVQGESFASLKRRERTSDLAIVPDELDEDSVELSGYAKDAWDELLADAADDEVARDALRLFYRLAHRESRP
ncbi:MAG: hypothetical protein U5O39_13775 [Gammaproteobacteria bacterium]|nr:hypothetical protein [Gammaproteobacteria bacterium]